MRYFCCLNGAWQFFQHLHALETSDFQFLKITYFPAKTDYSWEFVWFGWSYEFELPIILQSHGKTWQHLPEWGKRWNSIADWWNAGSISPLDCYLILLIVTERFAVSDHGVEPSVERLKHISFFLSIHSKYLPLQVTTQETLSSIYLNFD